MKNSELNEFKEGLPEPFPRSTSYQEYGMAFIKGTISSIPTIGPIISECIDARSAIKRKRIEDFVIELKDYLQSKSASNIKFDKINQEGIGDIFEEIILSVSKTKLDYKKLVFRNILCNSLDNQELDSDLILHYISITNRLSILQFNILKTFELHGEIFNVARRGIFSHEDTIRKSKINLDKEKRDDKDGYANNLKSVQENYNNLNNELRSMKDSSSTLINPNIGSSYGIENDEFEAEIQDLIAMGLLYQSSPQRQMIALYDLTKKGRNYLSYIRNE